MLHTLGSPPAIPKQKTALASGLPAFAIQHYLPQANIKESFARRALRDEGALAEAMAFAARKWDGDITRQIFHLTGLDIQAATGRARGISNSRRQQLRTEFIHCVHMINNDAERRNPTFKLRNVSDFSVIHVEALLREMSRRRLKRNTIHNYMSVVRRVATLVGRRDQVPDTEGLEDLVLQCDIDLDIRRRDTCCLKPFNWSAVVDVEALLKKLDKEQPHLGLLCRLMRAFGLRRSEVLCLRPHAADFGVSIWVHEGTKGKRERFVPLSTDPTRRAEQLCLLQRAKVVADANQKKHLGFAGKSLDQSRGYLEFLLRKSGITEADLGVKAHGLRAEYACSRFEELTGLPAPVLRLLPLENYMERIALVKSARKQIALELGHARTSVVSEYIGSLPLLREERNQARQAAQVLSADGECLEKLGNGEIHIQVTKLARQEYRCNIYVEVGHGSGDVGNVVRALHKSAVSLFDPKSIKVEVVAEPRPRQVAGVVTLRGSSAGKNSI